MTKTSDATLVQRTGYLYRRLLLLQRLFRTAADTDSVEWLDSGDEARDLALCAGIRDVLDELAEQAKVLTTIPLPLREWKPGDGPDDERWRALSEIERREVLALASGYEALIAWSENMLCQSLELAEPVAAGAIHSRKPPRDQHGAADYLRAERARVARFRQEMRFLERRIGEAP